MDMISLPSHISHALQPLDVTCFKPFKTTLKTYKNKWIVENNCGKVEKETLAHWVDLSLKRALSNSNVMAGFRSTGIWPLSLEKMQQKLTSSKTHYSIPSETLIRYEIMKEDLPRGEGNTRHFYIEDEDEGFDGRTKGLHGGAEPENSIGISQFLKLLKE